LETLWLKAQYVLEIDLSLILRFINLKDIRLQNFVIKQIQLTPVAELSSLDLLDIQIDANSLDLIFIHSRFINKLGLYDITINGILNFNTSFQNINRAAICGLNSSINFNRIFKAIGGSENTLNYLRVHFPTKEIESNSKLERFINLNYLICDVYPKVICAKFHNNHCFVGSRPFKV
jgi:hypothetical protein